MTLVKIAFAAIVLAVIACNGIFLYILIYVHMLKHTHTHRYMNVLILLNLHLFTGFGFTSISRMSGPNECHRSNECTLILPYCNGEAICRNGFCMCDQTKETKEECSTPDCKNMVKCATLMCFPPCDTPYLNMETGECKCLCPND